MKLRLKLGLTLLVLVVPFALALAWFQVEAREGAFVEATAERVLARMEASGRWECEEAPEAWPARRARMEEAEWRGRKRGRRAERRRRQRRRRARHRARPRDIWAYDSELRPTTPGAPEIPAEARRQLEEEDVASARAPGVGDVRYVAVRMPWVEGPCAVIVVRRPGAPQGELGRAAVPALAISLAAVLIAFLAAGPVVRRIRRLTDAVRRQRSGDPPIEEKGRDEIAELAAAFEERRRRIREQIGELERRDEALRSYIANTTHDVMVPVTVLQGHLATIERELEAGKPIDRGRLSSALEECHYLASLFRNMSAAAKLDAGAAHTERHPVDLVDVVERVAARHGPFADAREVALDHAAPEGSVTVQGDVTLIERAVGNLVHNAVRYNRSGGHVALVLSVTRDGFDISVRDDGPGIPEAEQSRVAERGFRGGQARTRHSHGMGLGLSIVRDVAERHGWTLAFERPDEGGLLVRLTGPLD